jgi:predicted kinase
MKHIKLFEAFLDSDDKSTIILFGPQGVGKSTLAKELGSKLGMEVIGSDDFIDQGDWASEEIWSKGWKIRKKNEYTGMVKYLKDNLGKPVILDVGGSHGVWEGKMLENIMDMIDGYPNRFLIIPSKNDLENQEFLRGRLLKRELDSHPSNIKYWEAILKGDSGFADNFDQEKKKEFEERIELVRNKKKYKTMAMDMLKSNQDRYKSLKGDVEWMVYDNSPTKKFDFGINKIEDYSKFFIDTMRDSDVANHIIYNKGKSSKELVNEIVNILK